MVSIATWPGWDRRKASASPNWVPVVYEQPGPLMTGAGRRTRAGQVHQLEAWVTDQLVLIDQVHVVIGGGAGTDSRGDGVSQGHVVLGGDGAG